MSISRIGAVTAAGTSLTPTTGLVGDIMIGWAFRSTAATIPTVPSGWETIGSGSGNTCAGVLAYRYCTGTGDASGTWTGATQLIITKYRGVKGIGGLGTPSNASSTSISYPGLTAIQTAGNSWIVGAAGHRTASNVSTAPTGMTNVTSVGSGAQSAFHDTNAGVSSWSVQSVTVNANSGHESVTCELLADSSTFDPYGKTNQTLGSANTTATCSAAGSGDNLARVGLPRASGKWKFAVTPTTLGANGGVGLITETHNTSSGMDNAGGVTYGNFNDGAGHLSFAGWNGSDTAIVNQILNTTKKAYVAVDIDNSLIWLYDPNTSHWNDSGSANPDTATGGFNYTGMSGNLFPAVNGNAVNDAYTWDGTASSAPSNASTFSAWDGGAVTHAATGVLTGPGSTIAGTAAHKAKHTATGALTGPGSTIAGTARRFRAHPSSGAITGPGSSISGTARRFRKHTGSGVLSGPGALIVGAASRHGTATSHTASGSLVGQGAIIVGIAARFGWTVNAGPSTVWTGNSAATTSWAANPGPATAWTANPAASGAWTKVPGTTTTWTKK